MNAVVLDEQTIRRLIGPRQALDAVRHAFELTGRGQVTLPPPLGFDVGQERGEVHVKAAHLHGSEFYSIKIASGFYGNTALGLPAGNGMVTVFDVRTGRLCAVLMDNGYLTELRTGAAGGLAADLLARRDAHRVAMIGCGAQARYQLEALCLVRPIAHVNVCARSQERAQIYTREVQERWNLTAHAVSSVPEALRGTDVVVTTTPSRAPLVRAEWLEPGMHITAMGSDGPEKQELDAAVLRRANKIVADHREQCMRYGELQRLGAAKLDSTAIYAELGELAAGLKPGRTTDEEITLADLTGVGVQDAAVANYVIAQARLRGLL